MSIRIIRSITFLFVIFYCGQTDAAEIKITRAFPNLEFISPVDIQYPEDNSNRLFVVSQPGRIHVFDNTDEVDASEVFLDIRDQVLFGGEQGLLGLAFHPDFISNGYFYVNYTTRNPRRTVVSRFTVSSSNNNETDVNSEVILMEISQPYSNHNGGQIAFGPDNYLYISTGDGGSAGDPQNNSQNLNSLLGKILRIDVDNVDEGKNYSIPEDNPYKDNNEGIKEEIYAYGLRNVWKFSFDSQGRLWAADVGQNELEEISLIENGKNYGWRIMEGSICYTPANCDKTGLELPIWEYPHNSLGGFSVTGGYVYEGSSIPALIDKYVYGDFISGNFWAFDPADSSNLFIDNYSVNVSTFGVDQQKELYIADYDSGILYRFYDDQVSSVESLITNKIDLKQNYPNPFNPSTTISYSLAEESFITLDIFDLLGRKVASLVNKKQSPGNYSVTWNASISERQIPSGAYLYKLSTNRGTITRKMMMIK